MPPRIIHENANLYSAILSVVIEKNETYHLVWAGDSDGDRLWDSLCYLRQQDFSVANPVSFRRDSTIMISSVATVLDLRDQLHVLWSETQEKRLIAHSTKLYYSPIENGTWLSPTLITEVDNPVQDDISDLKLLSLPDSSLLACWSSWYYAAIWFSYFDNGQWSTPFRPFPEWSFDPQLGYGGISGYPDMTIDRNNKLHMTFRGVHTDEEFPPGANLLCQINYVENAACNRNWETVLPRKIHYSTNKFYYYTKIVVTNNDIRYIIWTVDSNLNIWPDDIYYCFSRDGENWSEPISIAKSLGEFVSFKWVVCDHSNKVHVLWEHLPNNPDLEPRYYYAVINEAYCTAYEAIPFLDYRRGIKSLNLIIDTNNREHLFWVEVPEDSAHPTGALIKHTWRDLPTGVVGEKTNNKCNQLRQSVFIKSYPNPFNELITINIEVSEPLKVTFSIYNTKGQLVTTLLSQQYVQSRVQVQWNGTNQNSEFVSSGVYLYVVKIQNDSDKRVDRQVGKFILLR